MRFAGTCEPIAPVDVRNVAVWVGTIDFADWPQQRHLGDGQLRPAMVTDPDWHDFDNVASPVVAGVMRHFPGRVADTRMLSVVMPGHSIEPHTDSQPPHWLCRVHVPLMTDERAFFVIEGKPYHLAVGMAYRVNTEREHSVVNNGVTPRIHLMFDVRAG